MKVVILVILAQLWLATSEVVMGVVVMLNDL